MTQHFSMIFSIFWFGSMPIAFALAMGTFSKTFPTVKLDIMPYLFGTCGPVFILSIPLMMLMDSSVVVGFRFRPYTREERWTAFVAKTNELFNYNFQKTYNRPMTDDERSELKKISDDYYPNFN